MIFLLIKIIVTAGLIVLISEIAKVNDKLGGLIAAMPIITLLVILWMYYEGNSDEKISSHMSYTLLYIVPTIPMFIVFPFVISKFGFYIAFLISILVTVISVTILNLLFENTINKNKNLSPVKNPKIRKKFKLISEICEIYDSMLL